MFANAINSSIKKCYRNFLEYRAWIKVHRPPQTHSQHAFWTNIHYSVCKHTRVSKHSPQRS